MTCCYNITRPTPILADLTNHSEWTSVTLPDESEAGEGVDILIKPEGNMNAVTATLPPIESESAKFFIRLLGEIPAVP